MTKHCLRVFLRSVLLVVGWDKPRMPASRSEERPLHLVTRRRALPSASMPGMCPMPGP
jgi:hypothetical protein